MGKIKERIVHVKEKGSATIEMALLMPMMIIIFLALIYLSAYLYNRQSMETIACIGIHKGLQMEHDSKTAVQKEVEKYVQSKLDEKLIFSPDTKYAVDTGKNNITITIELTQHLPFVNLTGGLIGKGEFHSKTVRKAKRIDPAKILW